MEASFQNVPNIKKYTIYNARNAHSKCHSLKSMCILVNNFRSVHCSYIGDLNKIKFQDRAPSGRAIVFPQSEFSTGHGYFQKDHVAPGRQ